MAASLGGLTSTVWAADPVLIQNDSVSISTADMQADSLRMPPEMRGTVLSKPQTVRQIATNLYTRRALAQEAQTQSLDKDPAVAAALRIARDQVLADALMQRMDQANTLSDAKAEPLARTLYKAKPERFQAPEQVRVRHILIAGTTPEAQAQAEKLLADLKGGADFATLAKERSADKGSAERGGDLGFLAKGRTVPEFDQAAFALQKPGELSGVVKTQFGYHVVKLEARRPAGLKPFEEVRDELLAEVRKTTQDEARMAEVNKLQKNLKVNQEAIDAYAASHAAPAAAAKPAP
ncbi:Peptidyl-prolyl cis-trans isomerase C [Paracidovorax anthurii]|uniref:peptidylprolyl isomerase n=2 Tax=Paracidovorax anthurii TaxID=78229 RepID=A0A328Z6L4_9BURK|nr:peptidyl-prolyl cis-trans isomerase C [Paracidovorax anthurii]